MAPLTLPIAGCPTTLPCPAVPDLPPALPSNLRQVVVVCLFCGLAWAVLAIGCFLVLRQRRGLWQRKIALFAIVLSVLSLIIAQRAWAAYLSLASIHWTTTFQLEHYLGAAYDSSIRPMIQNFRGLMVLDMLALAGFALFLLTRAARTGFSRLRSRRANAAPYPTT
ncbi:MAG TPA: hypothetical protein VF116_03485 [Ktedonobacterales bacterium]